ncbi:MAG: hypothetical protein JSV36_17430 [Anaerolineae bacterium]|nr:MAG: hypothetical protein JSV36_17430 [Anaerolineae bacterium]
MPTALFFPRYLGGGFGHVSRCLALAEELKKRNWHTSFSLAGTHAQKVLQAGHPVYQPRHPFRPKVEERDGPAFTVFSDMGFQLVRDRFHSPRIVQASVREMRRLIKRARPDVLVGDAWPLTGIAGQLASLPVVQIVRSAVHPAAPKLIWWQDSPAGLVSPDPRPIFNPVLRRHGLPEIQRSEDLLTGDMLLVPSVPELDPLPEEVNGNTHYVGALTLNNAEATKRPLWLYTLDPNRPVVYVTIGGGASQVGSRRFFAAVDEALDGTGWQGVISTSARFSPSELGPPPPKVRLEAWVPGPAVIACADVLVFHGGYGTMMETLRCGTPSIVLPFHTEQEANGRRLEASGAAQVLLPSQEPLQPVPGRWKGGRFVTLVRQCCDLTAAALRKAISEALENESYRQNAHRLSQELTHYGGPSQAADLIESLVP